MSHTPAVRILFCALLFSAIRLPAPRRPSGPPQKTEAGNPSASAKPKINVCALLTSAEIEAVQGEAVKETKLSIQSSGGMLMSQCLFLTATFAKSVSLALAAPDPARPSALTPRRLWGQQFHSSRAPGAEGEKRPGGGKASKKPEPQGENEEHKLRRIAGLGEEAYWVGSPIADALYVLQGDTFLRISVGGIRAESARIEGSMALARAVLKRL